MLNKKCGLCVGLITLLGVFVSVATADPLTLPPSGVQLNVPVSVPTFPPYQVTFSFGSGGGFAATIGGVNTVMWCVDAMEDIAPPANYNADLVKVSQVSANSPVVRYGGVVGASWTGPVTGDTTAQQRYEMAAYLVSLYPGIPAGPTQPYTLTDQEIQAAIWEIMWNNSITPGGGITLTKVEDGSGALDPTNAFTSAEKSQVAGYITAAQNFVNNPANASFFNNFAVVSGGLDPTTGALLSPGTQTYIVLLTPEPASIILFGSLIASALTVTRRHRARRVSQVS